MDTLSKKFISISTPHLKMENILPLSIFLVNLAPSSQIFNQAGPKSNPLPHSESQSSTSRKSTRLAVIFALAFTAVATLRYAPFVRCRDLRCQDEDGWAEWVDSERGRVISWFQQWLQEGYSFCGAPHWRERGCLTRILLHYLGAIH
nr:uncharacterized protein LOC103453625 isoform X2 [Malus domestica]